MVEMVYGEVEEKAEGLIVIRAFGEAEDLLKFISLMRKHFRTFTSSQPIPNTRDPGCRIYCNLNIREEEARQNAKKR